MKIGLSLLLAIALCLSAPALLAMDRPQSLDSAEPGGQVPVVASPEPELAKPEDALRYLADIRVHSAEELQAVLQRVDQLMQNSAVDGDNPVVFLLHGEEARTLIKGNYQQHKSVVDLAARLSAFGVVDIKVCETWAGRKGLDKNNLQPFVETVPYAPEEEKRLTREQGYIYF